MVYVKSNRLRKRGCVKFEPQIRIDILSTVVGMLLYWLAAIGDIAMFAGIDNTGEKPFAAWIKCTTVLCGIDMYAAQYVLTELNVFQVSLQGARKGKRSEPFRWE